MDVGTECQVTECQVDRVPSGPNAKWTKCQVTECQVDQVPSWDVVIMGNPYVLTRVTTEVNPAQPSLFYPILSMISNIIGTN